ncbi:hypothetical protein IC582_027689 [Cucumis melo]
MGSFSVKNIAAMAIWRLTHFSGMTIWHLWMNDDKQRASIQFGEVEGKIMEAVRKETIC